MAFSLALLRAPTATARRATAVTVNDIGFAALVFAVEAALALLLPPGQASHPPDAAGWLLLLGSGAVLVWRRRAPMWCLLGMLATVAPYHYLENIQEAPILSSMVALYALAVAGPPNRTFLVVPTVLVTMTAVMSTIDKPDAGMDMLRSGGWIVAVPVAGEVVRMHRNHVAAIVERAERAERTREEEAARRVAEERLRIARDLHDLLAHSITLIGVQTSVAAHVLLADPERLDRTAVAGALDAIAETCRQARVELRTTLRVLRADGDGPLPDLAGIPSLTRAAEAAGAHVELSVDTGPDPVPAAVGAAAFRIVQESLTNVVRHAGGPGPRVTVRVERAGPALHLLVADDGAASQPPGAGRRPAAGRAGNAGGTGNAGGAGGTGRSEGFGIVGMRERARSVGGTLAAGPREDGPGFAVTAELPLAEPSLVTDHQESR